MNEAQLMAKIAEQQLDDCCSLAFRLADDERRHRRRRWIEGFGWGLVVVLATASLIVVLPK